MNQNRRYSGHDGSASAEWAACCAATSNESNNDTDQTRRRSQMRAWGCVTAQNAGQKVMVSNVLPGMRVAGTLTILFLRLNNKNKKPYHEQV